MSGTSPLSSTPGNPAAHRSRWPPEIDLLVACARLRLEPDDLARVRAAVQVGVDWSRVLQLATVHGLLPLLNRQVASSALSLPPGDAATLREQALATAGRSLQLAADLLSLLRLGAEHGITVVPLKGPVLAQQVYGSVALRQIGDLDVLLRERDLERFVRLLNARGYQPASESSASGGDFDRRNSHHVSVVDPRRRITVELHHCLLRPRARNRWDLEMIGPRLERTLFMGHPVSVLTREDLLVYLCEHGAEHTWSRLEWLVAVAELVRHGQVRDWTRVRRWAHELGATRRVSAALLLANELLGAGATVDGATRERAALAANRAIVLRRLLADPLRTIESPAERFGYLFLTDRTPAARLRRCWTTLMTPSLADTKAFPLPKPLFPLYRVLRPVRLLARRLTKGH